MTEVESDDPGNPFPLVMAMKFKSKSDIEEALSSKVRWESKNISKTFCRRKVSGVRVFLNQRLVQIWGIPNAPRGKMATNMW